MFNGICIPATEEAAITFF